MFTLKKSIYGVFLTAAFLSGGGNAVAHPNFPEDALPKTWREEPTNATSDENTNPLGLNDVVPFSFKGTAQQGHCRLVIWDVGWDQNTNWLGIQGGRENCSNPTTFTVQLRKELRFRPDVTIAQTTGTNNQIIRAYSACQGPGRYYGFVDSQAGAKLRGDSSGACR